MNAEDRAKGSRAARSPPAPSSPDKGAARDRDGHSQVTADGRPREFGKQPKKSKPQQAARAQDEGVGGTAFPALATPGAKERPAGSPTGGGSKDRGKDTLPQMATATPTKPNSGQRSSRSRRSSSFVSINASEAPTSRTGRARFGNSCRENSATAPEKRRGSKKKLSAEQLVELQDVFTSFDFDESGEVDFAEFGAMWRCLNGNPTNVEIRARFDACDINGDGSLTFDEFVGFMTDFMLDRTSTSTTEGVVDQLKHDNLKQAFECLADEQGYIYVPALLEIATTRGSEVLVSKEISDIAKKLNRAKVTRLTPYELASWCLNPKATFTQRKNSISHR